MTGIDITSLFASSTEEFASLSELMSVYGLNLAVLVLLSAIALFRKPLSCNRSYHTAAGKDYGEEETSNAIVEAFMSLSEEDEQIAEDLLDGATTFCSLAPILTLASQSSNRIMKRSKDHATTMSPQPRGKKSTSRLLTMPHGIQVLICEFSHPKDVVSLSCCCKTYKSIIDTSPAVWRALWDRDYSWIVTDWNPGVEAMLRSGIKQIIVSKEFYFRFGLCWPDYVLAGNNTKASCLVAIHGCVYNITPFLDTHPGSPDTLMVHAGRDATTLFEDMSHSKVARRIALSMCVVANKSTNKSTCCIANGSVPVPWGLAPTQHTELRQGSKEWSRCGDSDRQKTPISPVLDGGANLMLGRRQRTTVQTLSRIRSKFVSEQEYFRARTVKRYEADPTVLGEAFVFFDPFLNQWRVWYTTKDLRTIFRPAP
jgi:Cytochrome b5-like Heme/Steroid binding domain